MHKIGEPKARHLKTKSLIDSSLDQVRNQLFSQTPLRENLNSLLDLIVSTNDDHIP